MSIPQEIFAALDLVSPSTRRHSEDYLREIALGAAKLLNADTILVSTLSAERGDSFKTLILLRDGEVQPNISYKRVGSPCENVYTESLCSYFSAVCMKFPEDEYLKTLGAESYIGTPLLDSHGQTIGIFACIDTKPLKPEERAQKIVILRMLALNIEAQLERLQSDQKLQKAWRDLNFKSAALDQHCIVSISDNEGKLTYVNDKLCEISGWSRDELLNQPHRTLMSMHHSEEYIQHAWKKLQAGEIWRSIVHNKTKTGEDYWIDASYIPQMSPGGELERYIGVRTDITAMIRALDEAQESARAKSVFLSTMSHELRTPLNAILGYAQLMKMNAAVSETMTTYLDIISENSSRLLDKINTILSYAEDEYIVRDSQVRPVDMRVLVQETISVLNPMAREFDVIIVNDVTPAVCITAQPAHLRSIFENLISNAVKYNRPGGKVLVTSEVYADIKKIMVQDNGIGIDESMGDKIFNRFERGQAQGSVVPGSGLGLTIVRDLVAQLGGRINYRSTPGKGTTFTVEL